MQTSSSAMQCPVVCQDGSACRARPLPGEPWCLWHHPDRAALRDAARRAGGAQRARQLRAERAPVDLGDLLPAWHLQDREDLAEARADVARAFRAGRIAGRDASSLNTILDSFSADLDRLEADAAEADSRKGKTR